MYRHKLYLDTCILIPYYYKEDRRNKKILKFLKEISKIENLDLVLSDFVLTEFAKCYADIPKIKKEDVWKITSNLTHLKTIGRDYPLKFINVEGKEGNKYKFDTFFVDVREILMNCTKKPRIHLADAIHCAIMNNNKVKYIVTTNKKHFEGIESIIPLEPEDAIKLFGKSLKNIDWSKEIKNLKKLMEGGKIKLYKDMAPDLRKVMIRPDSTIVEETISSKLRKLLLEIKGKGE